MMFPIFAKGRNLALDYHARLPASRKVERGVFAKKKDSSGELYIYEMIGASFWGGGITEKDVADQLGKLKGVGTLDVYINSEGGDVFTGKAIYNLLKRFEAKKTVYIDGLAASAASFIAMAGDKIVTAENATWMIHEAWGGAMGSAADMRALADVLDGENKAIAGIYAAHTGQPAASFWTRPPPSAGDPNPIATGLMAAESWMNAEEALALKLTDEIQKNAPPAGPEAAQADALAQQIPAFQIAKETQARIAAVRNNRLLLAEMEQSILNDRRRASPAAGHTAASRAHA
jgi:ATP-dependent Clp protease protease subunit